MAPSGRGSYAVCLVFAALLRVVFAVGCDAASIYFVAAKRFSVSEGITYTLIYGGIGSGLAIVTGLVLMQLPLSFFDKATPTAFYLALFSIPTSIYSLIFMRLLTSVYEFGWFAIISIMYGLVQFLSIVVFLGMFSLGVSGALFAILVADIVAITSALFFFRWKYDIKMVSVSMVNLWEMLHYGARYHIGKISNQANIKVGTMVLAFFATREEIGLFAVASMLTFQATVIPDVISTVLMPRVAGDGVGKKELVARCFRLTAIICGILLLVIAVFAEPIVVILFSPKFLPAVLLIRILSIGVAVRCACKVFETYLLGINRPGSVSISVAIGTVVNLVVLWLFLPVEPSRKELRFGMAG